MELKQSNTCLVYFQLEVLIAPLWNWNDDILSAYVVIDCSNCTFMELKLLQRIMQVEDTTF